MHDGDFLESDRMEVTTERDDGVLLARVDGRIDGATVVGFEEAIRTAIEESDRAVLMTAKMLMGRDAGFALCPLSEPIRDVFRVSGFDRIVLIHASRATSSGEYEAPAIVAGIPTMAGSDARAGRDRSFAAAPSTPAGSHSVLRPPKVPTMRPGSCSRPPTISYTPPASTAPAP